MHTWLRWRILILLLFFTILISANGLDDPSKHTTVDNTKSITQDNKKNNDDNNSDNIESLEIQLGAEDEEETEEDTFVGEGLIEEQLEESGTNKIGESGTKESEEKEKEKEKETIDNKECVQEGTCTKCERSERRNSYCDRTGYRMMITCRDRTDPSKQEVVYESCHGEAEVKGVYLYEAMAFGFFILSCYLVRIRRAKLVQQQADKIAKQIGSV